MIRSLSALLFAALAFGPSAQAGEDPVVVELFTSQGCSSCPPADALMRSLAAREEVIGLALHVDYWDYIGWKDHFALPGHTDRQQGYARVAGRSMIYTPQMIVAGREDVRGADAAALEKVIAAHRAAPDPVRVRARVAEGRVSVAVEPLERAVEGSVEVILVRYAPLRHSSIKRGENAGRSFDYANVVESWETLGMWDGRSAASFEAAYAGEASGVVLIQHTGPGAIIAAARVE